MLAGYHFSIGFDVTLQLVFAPRETILYRTTIHTRRHDMHICVFSLFQEDQSHVSHDVV